MRIDDRIYELVCGVNSLSEIFQKDVRTIQNYADLKKTPDPMPKIERGEYPLVLCIQWMIERLRDEIEELKRGDETKYKLEQEGQRLTNAEKKIRLRKLLNELIDKNDFYERYINEIHIFNKALNALIYQLNTDLKGVYDERERLTTIRESVKKIRNRIGNLDINKHDVDEEDFLDDDLTFDESILESDSKEDID